jgi:hypothetical protein
MNFTQCLEFGSSRLRKHAFLTRRPVVSSETLEFDLLSYLVLYKD